MKEYYSKNQDDVCKRVSIYNQKNNQKIKQKKREYRQKNKFKIKNAKKQEYENQGWIRQTIKDQQLKLQAFAALGGKCVRCGFSDSRALQIDHINGGGKIEADMIGIRAIRLKIIYGNTQDYQLLCANCNWIKRAENGEVGGIHKQRKDRVQQLVVTAASKQTPYKATYT